MKPSTADLKEGLPRDIETRERSLTRGEMLFRKDDPTVGLYEIEQGQVRLTRVDQTGHEVVLHVAGPGDLIAEASLFSTVYHCDAVAMTDARVPSIPRRRCLPSSGGTPKHSRRSPQGLPMS